MGAADRQGSSQRKPAVWYLIAILFGLISARVSIDEHFAMSKGVGLAIGMGVILGLAQPKDSRALATALIVVAGHLVYIALH